MPARRGTQKSKRLLCYPCRVCGADVFKPDDLDWWEGMPSIEYIRYLRCTSCTRLDVGRQKLTGYRKSDFESKPGENRLTARVEMNDS